MNKSTMSPSFSSKSEPNSPNLELLYRDTFYIQFFKSAFPDFDFSPLEETNDMEQMAANIQSLIDLLSQNILMYDLSHIQGEQIVSGNYEHCINLLQLAKEISGMMNSNSQAQASGQLFEDDEEDPDLNAAAEDNDYGIEGDQFHPDGEEADLNDQLDDDDL